MVPGLTAINVIYRLYVATAYEQVYGLLLVIYSTSATYL
jgi:hypothetical protein